MNSRSKTGAIKNKLLLMKQILFIVLFISAVSVSGQKTKKVQKENSASQYALIEASRQKMIGNLKEAIILYENCIKSDPLCDAAYFELGTIYNSLKESLKAESYLENAFNLDQQNYWYGMAFSEILKNNGKHDRALSVLNKLRKTDKNNALAIDYKIADIYSHQGQFNKAIKKLNSIEKSNGVSEMISFRKIDTYKKMNDQVRTESELIRLIERVPDYSGYRIILAEHYLENNDTSKAILIYEEVCGLDSLNIYAITNLAKLYINMNNDSLAFFYLNRAFENNDIELNSKLETLISFNKDKLTFSTRKKYIEQLITTLLLKNPDNFDVKTVAYDFYNGSGNHILALNLIKQILEKRSDSFIMWQQALYNASMLENYDEIIDLGEKAKKLFPNQPDLYLYIGMSYMQKENFENAYSTFKEGYKYLNELEQNKIQYLIFIAESSYKTGRKDESFIYYEEVIKNDPKNDMAKNNYSYFLALEGRDLEKAKVLSGETIKSEPANSTYLDTYGWVLFTIGNYSDAKIYLEKALKISNEKDPEILFHFAEVLRELGDFQYSGEYYKKAEELGFDKETIKLKLTEISK